LTDMLIAYIEKKGIGLGGFRLISPTCSSTASSPLT
jgi:hypothetical protein